MEQDLKGRIDIYECGHVTAMMIALFIVVLALDEVGDRLRYNT